MGIVKLEGRREPVGRKTGGRFSVTEVHGGSRGLGEIRTQRPEVLSWMRSGNEVPVVHGKKKEALRFWDAPLKPISLTDVPRGSRNLSGILTELAEAPSNWFEIQSKAAELPVKSLGMLRGQVALLQQLQEKTKDLNCTVVGIGAGLVRVDTPCYVNREVLLRKVSSRLDAMPKSFDLDFASLQRIGDSEPRPLPTEPTPFERTLDVVACFVSAHADLTVGLVKGADTAVKWNGSGPLSTLVRAGLKVLEYTVNPFAVIVDTTKLLTDAVRPPDVSIRQREFEMAKNVVQGPLLTTFKSEGSLKFGLA